MLLAPKANASAATAQASAANFTNVLWNMFFMITSCRERAGHFRG